MTKFANFTKFYKALLALGTRNPFHTDPISSLEFRAQIWLSSKHYHGLYLYFTVLNSDSIQFSLSEWMNKSSVTLQSVYSLTDFSKE